MSPEGYNRYLKITLEKMRARAHKKLGGNSQQLNFLNLALCLS
jgi:hypothetical protein